MVVQLLAGSNIKVSKDQLEVICVSGKQMHCLVPILFSAPSKMFSEIDFFQVSIHTAYTSIHTHISIHIHVPKRHQISWNGSMKTEIQHWRWPWTHSPGASPLYSPTLEFSETHKVLAFPVAWGNCTEMHLKGQRELIWRRSWELSLLFGFYPVGNREHDLNTGVDSII